MTELERKVEALELAVFGKKQRFLNKKQLSEENGFSKFSEFPETNALYQLTKVLDIIQNRIRELESGNSFCDCCCNTQEAINTSLCVVEGLMIEISGLKVYQELKLREKGIHVI
jgi:hypothetical protein